MSERHLRVDKRFGGTELTLYIEYFRVEGRGILPFTFTPTIFIEGKYEYRSPVLVKVLQKLLPKISDSS
jgi:hypothetical protein